MALDFPIGTDFPANGNQIPDGHVYEGFYWDAATGAWKRVCERDKIGDCLDDDEGETVCDKLDFIQREIVELEEEIDAIATSVDRGTWDWAFTVNNYLDPVPAGKFYMVDGNNGLAVTTQYENVTKIIFSKTDAEGDSHSFTDDMVDKVLMLFDRPDDDFLESVITAVDEPNGANYAIIDVTHIQSLGGPTNQADAEGRYKARLNIFDQPTGGNAGEYVKKIGDTMSGDLKIGDTDLMPDNANTNSPSLTFETKTSGGTVKSASLYSQANTTNIYATGALRAGSSISALGNFQYNGTTRIGCGIDSNTGGYGYLGIGTSTSARPLEWNGAGIFKLWGYNGQGEAGQVLKLDDSLRPYWGASSASNYVKTNTTGFTNNLTITKTNNTYYITGG